jgi:hypothetical protein
MNEEVKVDSSEYVVNNPSELIIVIPDLKKGSWRLRLVTQYSTGQKCLKTPQSILFDKVLTVAED